MTVAARRRVLRWLRFGALVVVAAAPVVTGWYLVLSSGTSIDLSTPAVLTGVHLAITIPALTGEWRRPRNATSWLFVLASAAMVVAPYRALARPVPALLGALALLALPLTMLHALVALVDEAAARRRRVQLVVAMWVVPAALATAIVLLSGPRLTEPGLDDGGRRPASWAYLRTVEGEVDAWFRQGNPLQRWRADGILVGLWGAWSAVVIAIVAATTVAVVRAVRRARPVERRAARHTLVASVSAALACGASIFSAFPERVTDGGISQPLGSVFVGRWYADLLLAAPALAGAVVGAALVWSELVRPRLSRYDDGAVRFDPARTGGDDVRRLLGDATARVLFSRDGGGWVDEQGRAVPTPVAAAGRAVTVVALGGAPVAAVEYDESLQTQPDLVDVAVTSLGLSFESQRLAAVARAATDDIQVSALRLLGAAQTARTTIEERIADGPARRLATATALLERRPVDYDEVHTTLRVAVAEVREIAHGLAPATVLGDGLALALEDLVATADGAVRLSCDDAAAARLPTAIAVTVFAVVQHAARAAIGATTIEVTADDDRPERAVVIQASGAGGVEAPGQLLTDRIRTLGGTIELDDGRLVVELPLADGSTEETT